VTAPILWIQFGSVPVYAVLANALAGPVVAPLLGCALVCAALDPVLPGAAAVLAWGNGWLAAYLAWCARTVGGLPHARVSSLAVLGGAAFATAVGVALVRLPRHRRRPVLTALVITAVVAAGWRVWVADEGRAAPPSGLRVTFLDVGQGDGILLQVPEGAVLVDEGPPEADAAEQLDELGVGRLAAIVLTHPQRDHVGGAAAVLADLEVGFVLDPRLPAESPDEDAALAEAERRGVRVVSARAGMRFRLGRLAVRVVWPDGPGPPGQDPNEHAVVLLASYGETDVLLTADAESNVTLPLRLPPVEVLKVAHHGSADDGLADLLERLRPRVAVISCGAGNDYGHPAPSTLATLAAAPSLDTYRTDEDGAIVLESDGRRLAVDTER
jgi:competence protein ComEC